MSRSPSLPVLWVVLYGIVLTTPFNPLLNNAYIILPYVVAVSGAHCFLLYQQTGKDLADRDLERNSGSS